MVERPQWSPPRSTLPEPGDGAPLFSMTDALELVRLYGRMIGGVIGLGVIAGLIYLAGATPVYQARSQLLIEARVPHSFIEQLSEAMVALDTPQIESQLALLRSEQIAELVVKRHNLVDDPELGGRVPSWSLFRWWTDPATTPAASATATASGKPAIAPIASGAAPDKPVDSERMLAAMAGLQARMDVRRHGLSYAIDITYTSTDPAMAARMANAIADAYVEDRLRTRAHAARQGSEWLEERIAEIRRQMNAAALDVQQFRARRDYRIIGRGDRTGAGDGDARGAAATSAGPGASAETHTLEELEARAHTYRKIYESYLQGYAESVQRQSYPVTNDRVITRATKPSRKSRPRGSLILLGSVAFSAIGGLGVALLLYSLRGRRMPSTREPAEPAEGSLVKAA